MDSIKQKLNPLISAKSARRLVTCLIFVFIFEAFLFPPAGALASESQEEIIKAPVTIDASINSPENNNISEEKFQIGNIDPQNTLPKNDDIKVVSADTHVITAYTSEAAQCDASPCITANGFNVCENGQENTIAANWLEFGTKVRIPDLFGDRIFVVRDRMNRRHADRADIWFKSKADALKFGVKIAKIEILEP